MLEVPMDVPRRNLEVRSLHYRGVESTEERKKTQRRLERRQEL